MRDILKSESYEDETFWRDIQSLDEVLFYLKVFNGEYEWSRSHSVFSIDRSAGDGQNMLALMKLIDLEADRRVRTRFERLHNLIVKGNPDLEEKEP